MRVRGSAAVALLASLILAACGPVSSVAGPIGPSPPAGPGAPPGTDPGESDPVADPMYPVYGNPSLDVLHYGLDLTWAPTTRTLTATATLTIRATRAVTELSLDFTGGYAIDAVTVNGTSVTSKRAGNDLVTPATLAPNGRATLVVRYHGTPRSVPMPSGRSDFPEGVGLRVAPENELWTMQEPYGASTWYPSNDNPSDEALYDVAVTVPAGWSAVAHGEPAGVEHSASGGTSLDTFRYTSKDPVATYAATLAVGRYTKVTDTGPHGLPMTYWVRTGKDERFLPALRRTPAALAWLEQRFGPYPFATAGVVMVESESAMETQQMITYGAGRGADARSVDADAVEETVMHEFAHQWFGDSVTPTTWPGLWLNEGWAMYAQWLWSVDQGRQSDAEWQEWALNADQFARADAGPPANPRRDSFGETNVYAGPAYLLHLIHRAVGDQAFFALGRDWVQTRRNTSVDRAEFTAFVNQHTGRDFTPLINAWLDSPTTPKP